MKNKNLRKAFRAAFPKTLPVLAGYLVLGFGFGLLLQSKGYSFWWAILMCITIYGGSIQYVGVDLLASSASLITSAIVSLMVQARHLFYAISMLGKFRDTGKVKPYLIHGMTDETFSLICSNEVPEGVKKSHFYFFITALDQLYWIIGSTCGAVFGQFVDMNTKGVEFSMTALFIVIITDNLIKRSTRIPALIGLGISLVCLLIFGADSFLIPSMLGIAVALIVTRKWLGKEENNG